MTKPELFRRSQYAIERGRFHGDASREIMEIAHHVIDRARRLLDEMPAQTSPGKGKPE